MNQQTSPPLQSGSKFAAPPSMVTGIQPTGFAAKTSSATLPDAGSMARNSRYFDHLHFLNDTVTLNISIIGFVSF